jgi:multicomponent Na+:H+ antiporter subunit A
VLIDTTRNAFESHRYLSADWWYDRAVDELPALSERFDGFVHHGSIGGYFGTAAVVSASAGVFGFMAGAGSVPALGLSVSPGIAVVLAIASVAAARLACTDSQVSGVLKLSIVGAMIAVFYMLSDAPDLALTQVSVETLSLIIFMLILDRIPSYYSEISVSRKLRDAAIGGFVGTAAFTSVVMATSGSPEKISGYFTENAIPKGGGGNIVNVILVDFRGFDTLGEITVVGMAAMAILVLLSQRRGEPE